MSGSAGVCGGLPFLFFCLPPSLCLSLALFLTFSFSNSLYLLRFLRRQFRVGAEVSPVKVLLNAATHESAPQGQYCVFVCSAPAVVCPLQVYLVSLLLVPLAVTC